MPYFENHPNVFRAVTIALLSLLVSIAITCFYDYVSSPTDENWFRDSPSLVYVVKTIPVHNAGAGFQSGEGPEQSDSVNAGDLIVALNDQHVKDTSDVVAALRQIDPASFITMTILRPGADKRISYRVQRKNFTRDDFVQIPFTVHVFDIFPGGASDRAGMKVGDLVERINGKQFNSALEADRMLRTTGSGKTVRYDILRSGQHLVLNVTLANFGITIGVLIFVLAGFWYMAVGAFIALKRPKIKAARLLGYAFFLIGFFLSVIVDSRATSPGVFQYVRGFFIVNGMCFGFALWVHSRIYFPKELTLLAGKKWLFRILYGVSVISAVTVAVFGDRGFLAAVILIALVTSAGFFTLRKYTTPDYKKINGALTLAGYVMLLALFLLLALSLLKSPTQTQIIIGVVGALMFLVPVFYLYAIGRYRLLDLNLRVRRNVQYSLLTVVWAIAVYYALVWIFFQLPSLSFPSTNVVFTGASIEIGNVQNVGVQVIPLEKVLLMFLAITVTYGFVYVRRAGQKFIDWKYYRTRYDYRRAGNELAEVLASKLDLVELAQGIAEKLARLMRLKRSGVLFFRNEQQCCCEEAYGFDGAGWKEFCLTKEHDIQDAMKKFAAEFRVDYLPPDIRENFLQQGFQYIVPVRSKEKLIGALLVGEKLSEAAFGEEDLSFLSTAARQASVSIENAFLYEELAEKERLKHELEIARRIQLESLPQNIPLMKGLDIAGSSLPALEVGGDFFDYLNGVAHKITVIVGDVSGKGTSAALYMSKVQGIFRSLHAFRLSPNELLIRANGLLCRDLEKSSFITVLGAEFNTMTKRIVIARAGHLPLFFYSAKEKRVEKITPRGLGLGLNDAGVFSDELEEKKIRYSSGDVLLFVTDGITEARNDKNEDFGEERLTGLLKQLHSASAEEIRDSVMKEVRQFAAGAYQHDDQTVVVVKAAT